MAAPSRIAHVHTIDGPLPVCKGYQQLDSATLAAATGLTVPSGTTLVLIQAEAIAVRYRADGTNPTSTVGMVIAAGGEVLYPASEEELARLRFIRTAPGAILNIGYY